MDGGIPFDAIVVLGAALREDGTPTPALIRRARHGASIALGYPDIPLVVSGGATRRRGKPAPPWPEARKMREIAVSEGIPEHRVVEEARATRTLENGTFVRDLAERKGWSRMLVVTDGYHLPRALMVFRACGFDCRGSAAQPAWRSEDRLTSAIAILREGFAILWYRWWLIPRALGNGVRPTETP